MTQTTAERDELHSKIWAIADDLRGAVDGWDFKNYVLGAMFYRYVSEDICNYVNDYEGNGFDYASMNDDDALQAREELISTKGFFIKPSKTLDGCHECFPSSEHVFQL